MIVYAVVDDALSPDFALGVELEVFIRSEDAKRVIEEVRRENVSTERRSAVSE